VADLKPQIIVAASGRRNRASALLQSCRQIVPVKPGANGLALLRLGNGAYGAAIHREIVSRTGRDAPVSAVYVTLERLERKRMVCSYIGVARQQRGGRRRKHYLLDTAGQRALVRAYRTFSLMTAGLQAELDELAEHLWPGGARVTSPRRGW
jgi:PadR family transcriptional regulator PadR